MYPVHVLYKKFLEKTIGIDFLFIKQYNIRWNK